MNLQENAGPDGERYYFIELIASAGLKDESSVRYKVRLFGVELKDDTWLPRSTILDSFVALYRCKTRITEGELTKGSIRPIVT